TDAGLRVFARNATGLQRSDQLDAVGSSVGYDWTVANTGTTALSLASGGGCPTLVVGSEHFLDAMCNLATATAPIREPRTGEHAGALTLVCPVSSTNTLLVPVARRAARDIEGRLANTIRRERVREEVLVRARRHDLRSRRRPAYGWASLTEAERSLSE